MEIITLLIYTLPILFFIGVFSLGHYFGKNGKPNYLTKDFKLNKNISLRKLFNIILILISLTLLINFFIL